MRDCLSCGDNLPEDQFPAALSLVCTLCTKGFGATETHSIPIRPHPHNNKIARTLLKNSKLSPDAYRMHVGKLHVSDDVGDPRDRTDVVLDRAQTMLDDERPLIDILHEATFGDDPGMAYIKDKYALRMLLRKAHCFTLDAETSAMVADFSMATVTDLDAARQLAIPPFPVTWVEMDNYSRLNRMRKLNVPLTSYDPTNPPTARCGWLIHPTSYDDGWFMTYVTVIENGIWVAPLSFYWHAGSPSLTVRPTKGQGKIMEWWAFGIAGNVHPHDAFPFQSNIHVDFTSLPVAEVKGVMSEIAGELRHVWGLLIALGAGHLGVKVTASEARKHPGPVRMMKNNKPLLPLEHKVLHLHLGRKTVEKVVTQAITHHHNREHEVRSHPRRLKSGKVTQVKSHIRGDASLGRIEKTYRVEK